MLTLRKSLLSNVAVVGSNPTSVLDGVTQEVEYSKMVGSSPTHISKVCPSVGGTKVPCSSLDFL
ncbi:hypothetical protein [Sphingobacterium sp. UBA6320]|uniref:hypothetical protein n=1 Tax=Sphingobacterium sp. UBA6320 TaxID=1947510 RepID=UPI0025EFB3C4|nr:hypothetical protein [Sphingobacterium sp. UBA6320]